MKVGLRRWRCGPGGGGGGGKGGGEVAGVRGAGAKVGEEPTLEEDDGLIWGKMKEKRIVWYDHSSHGWSYIRYDIVSSITSSMTVIHILILIHMHIHILIIIHIHIHIIIHILILIIILIHIHILILIHTITLS